MLRRLFVLLLVLGGFLATCHPTNSNSDTLKIVNNNSNCTHGEVIACELHKTFKDISPGYTNTSESRSARKLESNSLENDVNEIEEVSGRKKKKGKGYEKLLLYFLGATKVTMLYVMIHIIGIAAGKALVMGKVALAIATALALKKASDHGEKVSYEIIKHPYHSYVQTHSSSVDYDHHTGFGESGYGHRRRRRILR